MPERARSGDRLFLLLALLAALVAAWLVRFVQDDAFISYTYARSLVERAGLTWFGDRIEGYTNFLWVLWAALGLELGAGPILWSNVGSLASFAGVIWVIWSIAGSSSRSRLFRILAVLVFATNYTNLAYATSGLETMSQALWLGLALLLLVHLRSPSSEVLPAALPLSLCSSAALLTRMDSAVPVSILGIAVLLTLRARRAPVASYLFFLLPAVLLTGAWLGWKLSYYGTIWPAAFYAKLGANTRFNPNGFIYLWRYLDAYLLWPIVAAGVAGLHRHSWVRARRASQPGQAVGVDPHLWKMLIFIVVFWVVYIVAIGGDFMEFRFFVPISPFASLLLAHLIYDGIGIGLLGRPVRGCSSAS